MLQPVRKFRDWDLCRGDSQSLLVFGSYEIVVQGKGEHEANETYQNIDRQALDRRCSHSETVYAIDVSV
jgi:hypothetical protein